MQVGKGSDGSGNLTGEVSTMATNMSVIGQAGATNHYVSGDTGRVCIVMKNTAGTASETYMLHSVERLHDNDGSDNDDGVFVVSLSKETTSTNAGNVTAEIVWKGNVATSALENRLSSFCPYDNNSNNGTNNGVYPVFIMNGPALPPSRNLFCTSRGVTLYSPITITCYGDIQTVYFIATPSAQSVNTFFNLTTATTANQPIIGLRGD